MQAVGAFAMIVDWFWSYFLTFFQLLFEELIKTIKSVLLLIITFFSFFQIKFQYMSQTYAAYLNGEDEYDVYDEELGKVLGKAQLRVCNSLHTCCCFFVCISFVHLSLFLLGPNPYVKHKECLLFMCW